MQRREFIALFGSVAAFATAWPLGAHTEQTAPVVGFLYSSTIESFHEFMAGFNVGLAEAGYVEGRNVAFEYRMADDQFERLPALAEDLVRDSVVVIVTASNVPPALAAKAATQTIPIVFMMGADPVENGLVADLSRPNGNVTGITILAAEVTLKRLALLRELVPTAATIAYLVNPTNTSFSEAWLKEQAEAARRLGVRLLMLNASSPSDIERAFATLVEQQAGALLVGPDTFFVGRRDQLVALAARYRVPTSYFRREFIEAGGLISYAASVVEASRENGAYVGRILKGEKPRDLPVVQPTKFELVINLKTAKDLGLAIPPGVLAIADEVIE
jgi:putative tryptophan/tyrosine transport system substrate-binding protein